MGGEEGLQTALGWSVYIGIPVFTRRVNFRDGTCLNYTMQ